MKKIKLIEWILLCAVLAVAVSVGIQACLIWLGESASLAVLTGLIFGGITIGITGGRFYLLILCTLLAVTAKVVLSYSAAYIGGGSVQFVLTSGLWESFILSFVIMALSMLFVYGSIRTLWKVKGKLR